MKSRTIRVFLYFFISLFFVAPAFSMTAKEKLDDALGRAYKAASEKNIDQAKDWFKKSSDFAREANSWKGLLDSGYGLSTLGLANEAKTMFDSAQNIISQEKDWHGAIALGYAYASLPKELKATESAINIWNKGKVWAESDNDLWGIIESGRGLMSVSKNKEAEECFDLAKEIVKDAPSEEAIKVLVQAYRKLGNEDKAMECAKIEINPKGGIPAGWVPTAGESVRGSKTTPVEVQVAQKASIDQDVARKQEYELQQKQLKQEEKLARQQMAYDAYRDYLYYYSYPYYGLYTGLIGNDDDYYSYAWNTQPIWAPRTYDEIYNWASWNCGRYSYVNGFYIEVDID